MTDLDSVDRTLRAHLDMRDVVCHRPVDGIIRRGETLHRRRKAIATAATMTALVVAAWILAPGLLAGTRTEEATSAFPTGVLSASDARPPAMSPADLAGVVEACAARGRAVGGPARVMATREPVATVRVDEVAKALWLGKRHWVSCTPLLEEGTWRVVRPHAVNLLRLSAGDPNRIATPELSFSLGGSAASDGSVETPVVAVGWVRADVDRLVIDTSSALVEAILLRDRFVAWLPSEPPYVRPLVSKRGSGTRMDARYLTIWGYDAEGGEIGSTPGW